MREKNSACSDILNDLWFCDCDCQILDRIFWQRLDSSIPCPRFHFASAPYHVNDSCQGFILFGGNISTGLLQLPVDCWCYQEVDAAAGGGGVWKQLAVSGPQGESGAQLPYGRVHSTLVIVEGESMVGHDMLLFGGESTRPYMYHGGVLGANLISELRETSLQRELGTIGAELLP